MPAVRQNRGCRFRQDRLRHPSAAHPAASDVSVSAEHLAQEQDLPAKFLGAILSDLRRGGLVSSQRGPEGGFKLARDADQISIADVVRVVSVQWPACAACAPKLWNTKVTPGICAKSGSRCAARFERCWST